MQKFGPNDEADDDGDVSGLNVEELDGWMGTFWWMK